MGFAYVDPLDAGPMRPRLGELWRFPEGTFVSDPQRRRTHICLNLFNSINRSDWILYLGVVFSNQLLS
jgi:hypothetical protein